MICLRAFGQAGDRCGAVPLADVAGERQVPGEWLAGPEAGGVTPGFIEYARPLVGDLIDYPVPLKDQLSAASSALQRQSV
jgi:hypothetical protein